MGIWTYINVEETILTVEVLSTISMANHNIGFGIQRAKGNAVVVKLDTRLSFVPLESSLVFKRIE